MSSLNRLCILANIVVIFFDVEPYMRLCWQVPRCDGRTEQLGLAVLDEPAAEQTDPTLLHLQLRLLSKEIKVRERAGDRCALY
jgi:hypothetical protein